MKKMNLLRAIIFLIFIGHCKRGGEIQTNGSTQTPHATPTETRNEAPNTTGQIRSLADIFSAPVKEMPMSKFAQGSQIETRVPNVTFQIPAQVTLKHEFKQLPRTKDFDRERKVHTFLYKDIEISHVVVLDSALVDCIKMQYPESGPREKFQFIHDLNRINTPAQGYFIEENFMGDHVYTLILDGGKDTHSFSVVKYAMEPQKEYSKLSDDDLKNILFSLKIK